jgi:outer membrane protein assembly factor BamB
MGLQVYDIEKDEWFNNHWVRGSCTYGLMPANGLIYTPPQSCACYYQSKLNGFNALSPEAAPSQAPLAAQRLEKGPAYGKSGRQAESPASAWPFFRHDSTRSSYVLTDVPANVGQTWKKNFGTKVSQATVAGGKVFLSAIDHHTVFALDAISGQEIWSFVADGRVDSPPSIFNGLAIFGCKDGFIYAVDAATGQLAWKFQGAPSPRKMGSYGQLESVWPISGSVLIQGGKLYCVAGRSMFLDGGLRMLILDPMTGELIDENVMDNRVPGTDKELPELMMGKHMPVTMPDILSSDGNHIYMKSQTFSLDGKRTRIKPQRPDTQYDEEVHLFSPISFLDDAWHQRTYMIYGRAAGEGWAEFQFPPKRVPCGRILCIDENNAYSYGRDPELVCNTSVSEYRLFSAKKEPKRKVGIPKLEGDWEEGQYPVSKEDELASNSVDWHKLAQNPADKLSALDYNWIEEEPDVMAKAMVLANDHLFIAGPRDVADEKALWGLSNEEGFKAVMHQQADWLKGRNGGVMQVFSKKNGKKLAEMELDQLPAFDGLVAAEGKLYMTTVNGSIICYGGK